MVLLLTATDKQGEVREFSCQLDKLDLGFEFLSEVAAQGETLLNATILEKKTSTHLPLETFDSGSFLAAMGELEKEWPSISNKLVQPLCFHQEEIIQLTEQRLRQCEVRIANIEQTLNRFRLLYQRAVEFASLRSMHSQTIDHYAAIISQYEVQLVKLRLNHKVALERLNQLID